MELHQGLADLRLALCPTGELQGSSELKGLKPAKLLIIIECAFFITNKDAY